VLHGGMDVLPSVQELTHEPSIEGNIAQSTLKLAAQVEPTSPGLAEQFHKSESSTALPAVQVCVRLRPLLEWERNEGQISNLIEVDDAGNSVILFARTDAAGCETSNTTGTLGQSQLVRASSSVPRTFRFAGALGPESSQRDVWAAVRLRQLVAKVAEGFHVTVLAYGQTGSGKTHTLEGFSYEQQSGKPKVNVSGTPPEDLGVVPRSVFELFYAIRELELAGKVPEGESYVVKVSFLQIYNENVYDLLNPALLTQAGGKAETKPGLRLRWDSLKERFYVENLFEYECSSAEDVLKHYRLGVQSKMMAATAMNAQSSRSHAVLQLNLVHRSPLRPVQGDNINRDNTSPYREAVSNLMLVDLAGSERITSSHTHGTERLKEAVNINQSLFSLRKVVAALSKRAKSSEDVDNIHIPYRDSKLTSLLQHAIGGNSFLLMLACLSPSDRHYDENQSTLAYASQAACIRNQPVINLDPKDRLILQLQHQLALAHEYIRSSMNLAEFPQELLTVDPSLRQRYQYQSKGGATSGFFGNTPKRTSIMGGRRKTVGALSLGGAVTSRDRIEHRATTGGVEFHVVHATPTPEKDATERVHNGSGGNGEEDEATGGKFSPGLQRRRARQPATNHRSRSASSERWACQQQEQQSAPPRPLGAPPLQRDQGEFVQAYRERPPCIPSPQPSKQSPQLGRNGLPPLDQRHAVSVSMYSDAQASRLNRLPKKIRESRSCSRIEGGGSSKMSSYPSVDNRSIARSASAGVLPTRANGRGMPMTKLHELYDSDGNQGSPAQMMLPPTRSVVPHAYGAPAGVSSTIADCKQLTPPRLSMEPNLNALGPTPQEASLWKAVDVLQAAKVELELQLQTSEDRVMELESALRSAASKAERLRESAFGDCHLLGAC